MKILIVGGVAGGASAAARIRRNDEEAEIILFEKGKYISYANCGMPYYIGGVISERDRLFIQTPTSFGNRFEVDVRVQSEVTAIDRTAKRVSVRTAEGKEYTESYDKLLLSPGAIPFIPASLSSVVLGDGVFVLRNVSDTDQIKQYLVDHPVRNAVVVGAGFIGLEMAENLYNAGITVSLVEMVDQVMAPIDYSMAAILHQHLREKGVKLFLGEMVEEIVEKYGTATESAGVSKESTASSCVECIDGASKEVVSPAVESEEDTPAKRFEMVLHSGCRLSADLVILSIGVRPNSALAANVGLEIGTTNGIVVNEFLQTSDEHIYAVGDAIEFPHPITGKPWLNYLAGPANRQGRIVADNIIYGNKIRYEGSIGSSIAKVFDLTVASTGLPAKRLRKEGIEYISSTIHQASSAGYYPGASNLSIKITFDPHTGRLFGAQVVGHKGVDKRIDQFALVIKQKGTIFDLTQIEHSYAPPFSSAKDPVAVAGYVAENILAGRMKPIGWRQMRDADPSKVTILDVRTIEEFRAGAIKGAINIPVDELRLMIDEVPNDRPVYIYCGVGLRGYLASRILIQNGYTQVYNLSGGYRTYCISVTN